MAQMTDDMAKHIVANYEASQSRYPLTAWEVCQLAQRWLATSADAPPPEQPAVELERYEDIEAIATCLDEDAAAMLEENPEDERAHNMQRASEILTALIDGAKAGREESP